MKKVNIWYFLRVFVVRAVILAIVVGIVGSSISSVYYRMAEDQTVAQLSVKLDLVRDNVEFEIRENGTEEKFKLGRELISYMDDYENDLDDVAMVIYEWDEDGKGELIASTKPQLIYYNYNSDGFLSGKGSDGSEYIKELPMAEQDSTNDAWELFNGDGKKHLYSAQFHEYVYVTNTVYIHDGKMYPKELVLFDNYLDGVEESENYNKIVGKTSFEIPEGSENNYFVSNRPFLFKSLGSNVNAAPYRWVTGDVEAFKEIGVNGKYVHEDFRVGDKEYTLWLAGMVNWPKAMSPWFDYSNKEVVNKVWKGLVWVAVLVNIITSLITFFKEKNHQKMQQFQRDLTNGLAHDLKSPLMVISGYAENLKENVHTEKRDHYADAIVENVEYMNELVADVLTLTKIDEGGRNLENEANDLIELVKASVVKYQPAIDDKSIDLVIAGTYSVNGDRRLLKRAMENLLNNAIKYTPEGGKIEIMALQDGIKLVNDSQEKQKNGLGLILVENICKLHKLTFTTNSEADKFVATIHQGSIF